VDVIIAEEVCTRVARRLAKRKMAAVIFPAVSYGLTQFAAGFCGTISVPADVTRSFLTEVMVGIASQGFGRLGAINHHLEPEHFQLVLEAASAAALRTSASIVVPDHRKRPHSERLGNEFTHGGSHAGAYETSLLLAAAPDLVDEPARASLTDMPVDLPAAIKAGARTFQECGGNEAYFGSPRSASPEEGERLFEALADIAEAALLAAPV
jgi:creatinine amidohydrolase